MARRESWETIARALGARMANHAHCPEREYPLGPPSHRRIEDGLAEDCPFCQDRDAYRRFVDRTRT